MRAAGRCSVGSCQGREVARTRRLITPPRPRTVEGLHAELRARGPPVSGNKTELQAFLAEADAQEQTMVRGTVRFIKGYRA
jgi:hypothetical protein